MALFKRSPQHTVTRKDGSWINSRNKTVPPQLYFEFAAFFAKLVQKKRSKFKINLGRNWFESGIYRAGIFNYKSLTRSMFHHGFAIASFLEEIQFNFFFVVSLVISFFQILIEIDSSKICPSQKADFWATNFSFH